MVLDNLGEKLRETLKKVAGSVFVDESLVNELVKDIQRALISGDVNVSLVLELTKKIKERALNEEAPTGLSKKEHLVNIVYEELVSFLGEEKNEIKIESKKPFKIMLVGLFGSGKTTTIGKIANYYTKRGLKVAGVGLDVHRPAAPEQLKQALEAINVPVYIDKEEKNALKIYEKYDKEFKKYDVLLIDTAGRDALSDELIKEIKVLNSKIKPDGRLLVLSADIGQAAQKQAEVFNENCDVTGVVVSKLDGTAKGGGALSACKVAKAPIVFVGLGEKVEDLETFNPTGFVSRLLGMGDIEALLEKAKEAITEDDAKDMEKKFLKGEFNLIDLYDQMESMNKMGSFSKLLEMVPGMGQLKLPKDALNVQEDKLKRWKYILNSCSRSELENPENIDTSRAERIAKGSGTSTGDVKELIKQYKQSKKMIKMMGSGDPSKLMKKFKGGMPGLK
ncbi:signal recognition particle protein [archaeon]|nr:signal recognition particle protein [archaeon]|tara:strand:- start:10274 stop:11620 length:1347 start_codon:yes stop_codon:yes gene_type:complete